MLYLCVKFNTRVLGILYPCMFDFYKTHACMHTRAFVSTSELKVYYTRLHEFHTRVMCTLKAGA